MKSEGAWLLRAMVWKFGKEPQRFLKLLEGPNVKGAQIRFLKMIGMYCTWLN